ncbi:PREDICTED: probable LRR receptor-like serine/threonine-protein kinase At3g47570 isoform X1 [Brassica oleracea var. oleracea]|uniref:non-specific serine/threonine protein kinase n=1 Tax=Brassica oleracea var. oleracea TaxID=109376 RepID=A0A0D3DSC7_BRAOL|nr:PREDICTED: probable LRR receptor-like serine/threonine-protein kinase At3g47570 isoform X1 [Brassica oleracea var. oleracea]
MRNIRLFLFIALIMLLEAYGLTVETDRKALQDFKSQVSGDKQVVLSSWNNSVHVCNWKGVTCGVRHKRVTRLDLGGLQLGGVISQYIGNLSFLISLDLSNNTFGGTIPHEVGNLLRLDYLDMSYNSLVGAIPISLFNCSRLLELYLNSNPLGGGVPSELGSLTKLVNLDLERNKLKGRLPASLGNLTSLMRVSFRDNSLQGEIPGDIGRLNQVVELMLAVNKFSGVFPSEIYNLSSLELLTIRDNHLSGFLRPDSDKLLPNLRFLNMGGNYFKGAIPASLANISNLLMLSLNANNLTGSIPSSFGKLQSLQLLSLFKNSLGSHSSVDLEFLGALTNCTQLKTLYVFGNRLGGHLPTTIANLSTNLRVLDLGTNFIFGSIPHDIGNLINLQSLALDGNHLTGLVPTSIGKLLQLEVLDLVSNGISGEIPSFIGNLTRLDALVLANNRFEGTIPPSLCNCTSLRYLIVELNKLNGTIPQEIMQIQSLVELDVAGNYLTGSLPKDVGRLDHLVHLAVENNRLFGQIPPSLGNCLTIELLSLQGNYFDGVIPDIKGLEGLKELDFSNNNLSGSIPRYLANFSSLEYLNLSVNNFVGSVPTDGAFRNATIVSVFGNKNLCGGIREFKLKPCVTTEVAPPSKGSKRSSLLKKVVIGVSVGITLLFLLFVFLLLIRKRKKTQQTNNQSPSTLEVFFPKMSYGEIRNATDGFSSRNMIGSGSFGTVFRAFLPAENKVVAVKVLNMQRRGAMKSFMAECESLKETRHRNLVKLLTACSSIDFQGNMFRALVYEFMPNGSLDTWLHPEEVEEIHMPSKTLTLLERLNIAIDVASVLDYLHVHCYEPIAHCDIKPSNVLLDNDLTAHVSDFGLARLLLKFDQESFFNQLSSAGVRGTIGYAAPEYGMGGQPSIQGDVYSFGVLVLEMLTGKRPTDELFGGNFTLHSYIKSVLPEQVLKIADKSFFDNGLIVGFPIAECLTLVLDVGLRCSEESPTNRLEMSEATKELISIRERFFKAR